MKGEALLQKMCVEWFNIQYTHYKGLLFAIPNGGTRHVREAVSMKMQGVTPGIPDLMLAIPNGIYHGLFIEMKWGANKCSPAQKGIIEKLSNKGYKCEVIYTFDDFKTLIEEYL